MVRKTIRFREKHETPFGIDYLEKAMDRFQTDQQSAAIELLFKEHAEMKRKLEDNKNLVDDIHGRFKTDLDVLRVRTGFSDKNIRILLELWNGFLIDNNQEKYLTTDDFTASPLSVATTKITKEIAGFRQRNLEAKRRKEMTTNE